MDYVLFESGCGKWIKVIPGNMTENIVSDVRYHSSVGDATRFTQEDITEPNFSKILQKFDIEWLAHSIEIQYVGK